MRRKQAVAAALAVTVLGLAHARGASPPAPEPAAELMAVRTEAQAAVVAARMRAGYFLDRLLLPGTRYMGRIAVPDLHPAMRAELEKVGPGAPVTLPGEGGYLVAQLIPTTPALLGEVEYGANVAPTRAVLTVGPTSVDLLGREVEADAEDLQAVCRARKALFEQELGEARAALQALPADATLPDIVMARARLGSILSFNGDIAGAITAFEGLTPHIPAEPPPGAARRYRGILDEVLGTLELRRGETDNCLMHHNREMCLFPLSPRARHQSGDGARRAIDYFTRFLKRDPDNLEVRWLLNVAAMTVGSYPDGLPAAQRIAPEAFKSADDLGRFWDVGAPAGVARVDNAGGSITDDFDGDGLIDIVVSSRDPCEPLRFFRNRGDGTFADETEKAGLAGQLGGLNTTQTDYDNDGRLDIFVMRGGWETAERNSLLRNNGDGTFTDVTRAAGLSGVAHRTHSAAWGDFDGDGWLDVFV
ncbi:MAG TPA: VCBS repeat-containing protein, partial [Vicinamibacteria bacterium]